jgi:hypothetical protein
MIQCIMEESKCDELFLRNQNNNLRQCLHLFEKVPKNIICQTNISGNAMIVKNCNGSVYVRDETNKFNHITAHFLKNSRKINSINSVNYDEIVNFIVQCLESR